MVLTRLRLKARLRLKDERAALLQDTAKIKTEFQHESTFLFT
jgi:hypothetical protein